jgi:cbb3-type cytochrome oxidase maturation protein
MSVIVILIIIGILVAGAFLAGFIWAVKSGQYDDTYSPSVRMLFDDSTPIEENQKDNNSKEVNSKTVNNQ